MHLRASLIGCLNEQKHKSLLPYKHFVNIAFYVYFIIIPFTEKVDTFIVLTKRSYLIL